MKNTRARLTTLLLAFCMSVSVAACGSSDSGSGAKTEEDELKEAYNELDENDKKELDELKQEVEKEEGKAETKAPEAEEPEPEDLGLSDPKYYAYYDDIAKSYEELVNKDGVEDTFEDSQKAHPVYSNGKIYYGFSFNKSIDGKHIQTKMVYSYDIENKELKLLVNGPIFLKNSYDETDTEFTSYYVKNDDLYLYDAENDRIRKIDNNGQITDYKLEEEGAKINHVFDNGKVLITGAFSLYDTNTKEQTVIKSFEVPSDHAGITQELKTPVILGYNKNSFYIAGYTKSTGLHDCYTDENVYEYNTDTGEITIAMTDPTLTESLSSCDIKGDYAFITHGKSVTSSDKYITIKKISDGSTIVNDKLVGLIGGGVNSYILYEKQWYKAIYPDTTCTIPHDDANVLIAASEKMSEATESAERTMVFPLNEKYYVFRDDAGYFLRTYEKGESEEELIVSMKQIEEDAKAAFE